MYVCMYVNAQLGQEMLQPLLSSRLGKRQIDCVLCEELASHQPKPKTGRR